MTFPRPHGALAALAIPVTSVPPKPRAHDTGLVLTTLIGRYQQHRRPISVNFRRLLPDLNSPDRLTHLLHPYPAKLLVHIPYLLLTNDLLSRPGDLVLDPFCGSGTVLLEAQVALRRAYGADANPLARLITRVKTTPLHSDLLHHSLARLLQDIPSDPSGPEPDVVNIGHWFYPSTIRQLRCLREAILDIEHPGVRDFLLISFSVCARKVSRANPRLSVPVRLRPGQYPLRHPLRDKHDALLRRLPHIRVRTLFERIAAANIDRLAKLSPASPASPATPLAQVICADARHLHHQYPPKGQPSAPLADESVQLIITSPPYPGAQKYIRSSSLSLGWLGLSPSESLRTQKGEAIGREEFTKAQCSELPRTGLPRADSLLRSVWQRSPVRALVAATYLNEMRIAFREMYRVLKPGGTIALVAANSRLAGTQFRTVQFLHDIALECGLTLTASFIDAIKSRGLMTKRNDTASVITREWVLLLTKPGRPPCSL